MKKILKYEDKMMALDQIVGNPWNPHSSTPEEMENLALSITERGMIHPIVVVKFDRPLEWDGRTYEALRDYLVIDGHQRMQASQKAYAAGNDDAYTVPVRVIGKLSEWEEWELAEIGQMANHQGGSLEDPGKTGKIVISIQERRKTPDVSAITGQRANFLTQAANLARPRPAAPGVPAPAAHTSHRQVHNVVLPFESADEVKEFESLIGQLAEEVPDRSATKGLLRSQTALHVLRKAVQVN